MPGHAFRVAITMPHCAVEADAADASAPAADKIILTMHFRWPPMSRLKDAISLILMRQSGYKLCSMAHVIIYFTSFGGKDALRLRGPPRTSFEYLLRPDARSEPRFRTR